MRKRIAFYALLLAIPASVGAALSFAYITYQKKVAEFNYQNELAKQKVEYREELTRRIQGDKVFKYPSGPAGVLTDDVKEYVENYERVNMWVAVPGTTGNYHPNVRGKYANTNDLGYRGTVNFQQQIKQAKKEKAEGKRVVVLVGASAAFGLYSIDDSTDILAYMQKKSAENDNKLVFYNFSSGSYSSSEELAALVNFAHMLNPDLLIIFDGYMDAVRLCGGVYGLGYGIPFTYLGVRASLPYKFESEWLDRKYDDASTIPPEYVRELFEHYSKNIRLMTRIMKSSGGTAVLATQPFLAYRNSCYRSLKIPESQEHSQTVNLRRVYPRLIETARATAEEEKIRYLDLTGVFEEDERCRGAYVDGVHMSSAGQKIIAENLYEAATAAIESLGPPAPR